MLSGSGRGTGVEINKGISTVLLQQPVQLIKCIQMSFCWHADNLIFKWARTTVKWERSHLAGHCFIHCFDHETRNRRIHCGRHSSSKKELFIISMQRQISELSASQTASEWVQQLLFSTTAIRLTGMTAVVISSILVTCSNCDDLTEKKKPNLSFTAKLRRTQTFARIPRYHLVLIKWKLILRNAARGSNADARHVLPRLWWIKKLYVWEGKWNWSSNFLICWPDAAGKSMWFSASSDTKVNTTATWSSQCWGAEKQRLRFYKVWVTVVFGSVLNVCWADRWVPVLWGGGPD